MSEDLQYFEWRATGRLACGGAAEIYASAITIQIDSLGVSSQDGYPTHAGNTTSIRSAQSQTSSFHIEPQVVLTLGFTCFTFINMPSSQSSQPLSGASSSFIHFPLPVSCSKSGPSPCRPYQRNFGIPLGAGYGVLDGFLLEMDFVGLGLGG